MLNLKSFAKINLYLEIVGNNEKGYHLLDSLIAPISLHDVIKIEESPKTQLIIDGPFANCLAKDENNIIIQAIKKLNLNYNFKIHLTKNIPTAAGLGGGSSNAATTILAINQICNLNLSKEKLMEIGLELGCDVPFFINQKIALISGIGEKITDVNFKQEELFVLIINPNKSLSTKKVFELFKEKYKNSTKYQKQVLKGKNNDLPNVIDVIKNRQNHLQESTIELVPEVKQILEELTKQNNCLIAKMSGSGATCFGLFKNKEDLTSAKNNMKIKFPSFYIKEAKLLS